MVALTRVHFMPQEVIKKLDKAIKKVGEVTKKVKESKEKISREREYGLLPKK